MENKIDIKEKEKRKARSLFKSLFSDVTHLDFWNVMLYKESTPMSHQLFSSLKSSLLRYNLHTVRSTRFKRCAAWTVLTEVYSHGSTTTIQTQHISITSCPSAVCHLLPHSQSLTSTSLFPVPVILPVTEGRINGIIQYVTFAVCLFF